ncbi:unnamed protein product, partial [Lampetra planeri]
SKGFFGKKERTLSIGNQLDREGRLRSELRPASRLDSSARLGLSRVRSAHRSRLSGLDSSGSPSPLQAGKTRLTAQLGLRGSTSAESEVSAAAGVVRIAVWRRGSVLTLVDDPTLHAASELWAPPTDRVPNCDSVSTSIRTSSPR